MHVFFVSIAAPGQVNPTLPLVRELVDRGHRVTYATEEKFRPTIESAGAALAPLPAFAPPSPASNPGPGALGELIRYQLGMIRDGVVDRHLERTRPDAVCCDTMTPAGRVAAEKLGLPTIALYPTYATNEDFPLRALATSVPGWAPSGQTEVFTRLETMSAELAAELGVPPIRVLGGPPSALNIVFIPRRFQVGSETFDDRFRFVGPAPGSREADGTWQPADSRPLLFVSLGTTPLNNNAGFFRMCVDAFDDGHWRVAMAIGHQVDRAELGALPGTIEVRPYFPQLAVLRHTNVFLSHTGMNSTMEALSRAVPIVAVPQQFEQELSARQVDRLGLGRHLTADLSPELLRRTVDEVHSDDRIRRNASDMSTILRDCGGAVEAADAIEAHLRT